MLWSASALSSSIVMHLPVKPVPSGSDPSRLVVRVTKGRLNSSVKGILGPPPGGFPHIWTLCFYPPRSINLHYAENKVHSCRAAVDTRGTKVQARNRTFSDHHPHLSTNTSVYTSKEDKMIVQGAELSMGMCFESTPTHWHCSEELSNIQSCTQFLEREVISE